MATSFVPEVTPLALHKAAQVTQAKAASGPRSSIWSAGSSHAAWAASVAALAASFASQTPERRPRIVRQAKGFATAEWMEETTEEAGGASTSSRTLTKSRSSSALSLSDGRKRVFDKDVLQSPSGEILSDGDAPEPEGAKELYDWMRDRGCTGLADVQLLLGGGVALRRKCQCGQVKEGQELFSIPKAAWLVADQDPCSVEALAWKLLRELWEEDSSFAPFVNHLHRQDLSSHPIFWEEDEVAWLRPSLEGFESVVQLRARSEERVARLLARVAAEVPAVSQRFEGNEEALVRELRWALATVEVKSFEAEDEGQALIALCPFLGDLHVIAAGSDVVGFEKEGDRLVLTGMKSLRPGEQLYKRVEKSGAWLLANLGVVPGSEKLGVPSDADLVECNTSGNCWLAGPETDPGSYPRQTYMQTKMELLQEHAKLDFRGPRIPGTPCKNYSFVLPDEAMGTGRLLPAGRFLIADIAGMGGDVKAWMERWFVRFFRHCKLDSYPSTGNRSSDEQVDEVLTMVHDTQIEVQARRTVATWAQQALLEKNQMIERIASGTGLPLGDTDGVIVVQEDQTVMAYFKAKRKDGSIGKSKKPREAVVLSIMEETLRVQFVGNKRRHEIPQNWVVSSAPLPDPKLLSSGCSPERLARGKLAITLLRNEKAIVALVLETLSEAADMLEELGNGVEGYKQHGDTESADKLMKIIRQFLDREMVELDEELAECLPKSLADIPSDPGHKPYLDKPLYSLPEGYVDPKFSSDMMLLDSDSTGDQGAGATDASDGSD
ncbi:unnamed protein product [Cladocopium goreaui]|uniref:Uncharacterized protein n=1 Tax=Cladocopium goreaui TaxID=2562237 RepID=A0A9P1DU02_9DINO|nr:unnamed protein product [Cladocopium goreaui]